MYIALKSTDESRAHNSQEPAQGTIVRARETDIADK